jgi:recombinational DNA repair protein RecR
MKKTITTLVMALSMSAAFAQVSDTLIIRIDTTTFKNVIAIIQKQLDSKAASNYVLEALSHYELIATKPKEIKK